MAAAKTRISAKVRAALSFMVEGGHSRKQASEMAGCSDHWLYQRLREPSVLALRAEMMKVLRESESSRVVKRVADLADGSKSDAVKMDANRFLADIAGEGPIQRGEVEHRHVGLAPGLTINLIQASAPAAPMLDITPKPAAATMHGGAALPVSVPHPSQRPK